MRITASKLEELKQAAIRVSKNSYRPYSKFPVGAALLTDKGHIVTGCNVENASFGLTICAERNAIFQAVALYGFVQVAVVVIYTPTQTPSAPCGACRQVIREFGLNAEVYSFCDSQDVLHMKLSELLPNSFGGENIKQI